MIKYCSVIYKEQRIQSVKPELEFDQKGTTDTMFVVPIKVIQNVIQDEVEMSYLHIKSPPLPPTTK